MTAPFGGLSPSALALRYGMNVGGRYAPPQQVAAIRARNAGQPVPAGVPSVQPVGAAQASALHAAGRGSGTLDPTRTATDPVEVQALRNQFSGSGVAGYNALSFLLGRNLAARVPGTQPPLGFHPTALKTVTDALALLPTFRVGRGALRVGQALRAGEGLDGAEAAARAAWRQPLLARPPVPRAGAGPRESFVQTVMHPRATRLLDTEATTQLENLVRRSAGKAMRQAAPSVALMEENGIDPGFAKKHPDVVQAEQRFFDRLNRLSGNRPPPRPWGSQP